MLGKIEGNWRRGQQRMRWLDGITNSMDMNLSKLQDTGKDKGAWYTEVHSIAKSQTRLSDLYKGFPGGASGKEPACQCRRCKRHGFHSWVMKIPRRSAWQSTPVFFPREFHGQRSLASYSPWDCTNTTEVTEHACTLPLCPLVLNH